MDEVSIQYGDIYFVLNTLTGKYYIGQTVQGVDKRWSGHLRKVKQALAGKITSNHFYNAIHYYGLAYFEVRTIFTGYSKEDLDAAEKYFITLFDSANPKIGYNNTFGGEGGTPTEETLEKMRISHTGKKQSPEQIEKRTKNQKGKKQTPEWIENRRQSRIKKEAERRQARGGKKKKGTPHSPEARARHRRSLRGRKLPPEQIEKMKGRVVSEDTRQKLRIAGTGKKQTKEAIEAVKAGKAAAKARREQEQLDKEEGKVVV